MKNRLILTASVLVIASFVSAFADPITFTFTGDGSGIIGGTPFGDSQFTITATGDTSDVQTSFYETYFINNTSASIEIDGVGTFDFISGTRVFANNNFYDCVGFSWAGSQGNDLYDSPNDFLTSPWDMQTSIGPIFSTNMFLTQWWKDPVMTDGGQLLFNSTLPGFSLSGSFAAVVQPVPEPSEIMLLGIGAVIIFFLAGKKFVAYCRIDKDA